MPGDEELGFEAAVAALGTFIFVLFLHFCLDSILSLFLFLNIYILSTVPYPVSLSLPALILPLVSPSVCRQV